MHADRQWTSKVDTDLCVAAADMVTHLDALDIRKGCTASVGNGQDFVCALDQVPGVRHTSARRSTRHACQLNHDQGVSQGGWGWPMQRLQAQPWGGSADGAYLYESPTKFLS